MSLFDFFTGDHGRRAADAANAGLRRGYNQASDLFGQGRNAVSSQYGMALPAFQELFGQGQAGAGAYGDAVGLGGAEGIQRATENFQALPGYQAGLNSGLDAIDRRAASRGMLGSGNTNNDTIRFATDYANRNFGDYVNRLSPYLSMGQNAATGIAGVHTGLGNALNQSFTGQGQLGFQTHAGIGANNAGAELAAGQGSANIWGNAFGLGGRLLGMV